MTPDLRQALRDALPSTTQTAKAEDYGIEGMTPPIAVKPASEEELIETLAACNAAQAAVVPWGSGSQMHFGMPLARYDVALDLTSLDGLLEYEPADLTVSVQVGMRLAGLEAILGENGQWLPLDPLVNESATIGGILATNASGPGRVVYGTARDFLIGIAVATPEGETIRAGGRVVKNVAGYDLGKLHIGALGTLGVITRASFKVAPLPELMLTIAAATPQPGALIVIAREAHRRGLAVNRLCLIWTQAASGWQLLVRMAGGASAVETSRRQLNELAVANGVSLAPVDGSVWSRLPAFQPGAEIVAKAAVMPTAISSILERLKALNSAIVAYPTAGIVYGSWQAGAVSSDDLKDLRRLCVQAGSGALVLEKAPAELRVAVDVWGQPRGDFSLMQGLKRQFDPEGILNPGRFVGGI
ncbi:MAG: FAD-binding protein [Dehalococcoidia bacterium]|nr:FAD-binding protein [Dehalococcoidia bacterium]